MHMSLSHYYFTLAAEKERQQRPVLFRNLPYSTIPVESFNVNPATSTEQNFKGV